MRPITIGMGRFGWSPVLVFLCGLHLALSGLLCLVIRDTFWLGFRVGLLLFCSCSIKMMMGLLKLDLWYSWDWMFYCAPTFWNHVQIGRGRSVLRIHSIMDAVVVWGLFANVSRDMLKYPFLNM